ncbi:MAG: ferritin-like domain-containing protein [Janthinobacterium lividum]
MIDSPDFLRDAVSRRTFLARMTAAGLGTAAAALIGGCGGSNGGGSTTPGTGLTSFADQKNFPGIPGANENVVVLNYALTLETLEADLYRQALNIAAGLPIATALPADVSSYSQAVGNGSLSPALAPVAFLYLQQYAGVEAAHRDFLRAAIASKGGTPVPANPKGYNIGLAAGTDLGTIMTLIRTVEETGVTAYLGAAGFLTDATLVQIAASIYTTEARHSAGVNYVLGLPTGPTGAAGGAQPAPGVVPGEFEFAQTPKAVLAAVKPFFIM